MKRRVLVIFALVTTATIAKLIHNTQDVPEWDFWLE